MTTAAITALEMFTQQQMKSQHRRCSNNSCHHSTETEDVHTATVAITAEEMFPRQQLSSLNICSYKNSCHHSIGDVHTITAAITAQHTRSTIKCI